MVKCKKCGKNTKLSKASEDRKTKQLCNDCYKGLTNATVPSSGETQPASPTTESGGGKTPFVPDIDPIFVEKKETAQTASTTDKGKAEIKKPPIKTPEITPSVFKPMYLLSNKYFSKWGVEQMDSQEITACCQSWSNLFNYVLPDLIKKYPVVLIAVGIGFVHIPYGMRVVNVVVKKRKKKKEEKEKYVEPTKEDVAKDVQAAMMESAKEMGKGFPAAQKAVQTEAQNVQTN